MTKKVAFDCKGTLMGGPDKVEKLFSWFKSKGCEMIIWSNSYSYALKTAERLDMPLAPKVKFCKSDLNTTENPEEYYMDIAVDDELQDYLATKHLILVSEIPENESEFDEKYGHLIS